MSKANLELKNTLDDYFDNFAASCISTFFEPYTHFPDEMKKIYSDVYLLYFFNEYIKDKELSEKNYQKDEFYNEWDNFIDKIRKLDCDELGKNTKSLKELILNVTKSNISSEHTCNKSKRFWKYYVCRSQESLKGYNSPEIKSKKCIKKEELPFYLILYTVYYYSTFCSYNETPFYGFAAQLNQYKIIEHINDLLSWCVSCFLEWYTYAKKHPSAEYNIKQYIYGIPHFLEHFGFFWHWGVEWHKNNLFDLFESLSFDPNSETFCLQIPDAINFLSMHRIYTAPHLPEKKQLFKKKRKDETTSLLSMDTLEIHKKLKSYFLLSKEEFDEYKRKYVEVQYTNWEEGKPPTDMGDFIKVLDLFAREFFIRLLLIFSQTGDNLLPYLYTHLCLYNLVYFLTQDLFDEDVMLESYQKHLCINDVSSNTWENIENYILKYKDFIYADINEDLVVPFLNVLKAFPSDTKLDVYIEESYLSRFDTISKKYL